MCAPLENCEVLTSRDVPPPSRQGIFLQVLRQPRHEGAAPRPRLRLRQLHLRQVWAAHGGAGEGKDAS